MFQLADKYQAPSIMEACRCGLTNVVLVKQLARAPPALQGSKAGTSAQLVEHGKPPAVPHLRNCAMLHRLTRVLLVPPCRRAVFNSTAFVPRLRKPDGSVLVRRCSPAAATVVMAWSSWRNTWCDAWAFMSCVPVAVRPQMLHLPTMSMLSVTQGPPQLTAKAQTFTHAPSAALSRLATISVPAPPAAHKSSFQGVGDADWLEVVALASKHGFEELFKKCTQYMEVRGRSFATSAFRRVAHTSIVCLARCSH